MGPGLCNRHKWKTRIAEVPKHNTWIRVREQGWNLKSLIDFVAWLTFVWGLKNHFLNEPLHGPGSGFKKQREGTTSPRANARRVSRVTTRAIFISVKTEGDTKSCRLSFRRSVLWWKLWRHVRKSRSLCTFFRHLIPGDTYETWADAWPTVSECHKTVGRAHKLRLKSTWTAEVFELTGVRRVWGCSDASYIVVGNDWKFSLVNKHR